MEQVGEGQFKQVLRIRRGVAQSEGAAEGKVGGFHRSEPSSGNFMRQRRNGLRKFAPARG
jgi:hypothetical protein